MAEITAEKVRRARLMTFDSLDGRSKGARFARDLIELYRRERGGKFSKLQRIAAERAGMLGALATDAKARCLAGDPSVSLEDCVRLDGAWRRAERALAALERPARDTSLPTYQQIMGEDA